MKVATIALATLSAPLVLGVQAAFSPIGTRRGGESPARVAEVTYTKHVAPILQAKCQSCHQPNSIAPMSLLTYEDATSYAREIKDNVSARRMPPWHIDRTVGIQAFKNDRGLSDEQIATIVKWIDAGTPRGDAKDLPPAATFPDPRRWELAERFGAPDVVVRSQPFTVGVDGQDKWWRPVTATGISEPRWVRAIEIKPVNPLAKKVVHHVLASLLQAEDGVTGLAHEAHGAQASAGLFMEWAVGKTGQIFPGDAGKLLLPDSRILWEIHTHANGERFTNEAVELAIYLYPKGFVPAHRTVLRFFDVSQGAELDIPPNAMATTEHAYVLAAPARLENFQPHMHMRGKVMTLEAILPDGQKRLLSRVSNFQWNWHVNYVYADSVAPLLPKGTTLRFTALHDNTADNPNNPDPRQWVGWGDRTVDEMAHCWIDVTYLDQAEFDRLVTERKASTRMGSR